MFASVFSAENLTA